METLPFLIDFFNSTDVLLLIMVRVSAFMIFLPVLSSMGIPMQVRLFTAFVISVAIFASGIVTTATYHDTPSGLIMLILIEFMAGATMGFVLSFVMNLLLFAGHFMDFSMGFAMVNVMDPVQQIQVPVMGNLLFMTVSVFLVLSGGLHEFLRVFFMSYELVPIGTALIIDNRELAWFLVVSFVGFVLLAIGIALPLVGTMLIIDICLGIMVKAVPQMNVFVVGMPLKVLVGLFLVFIVILPSMGFIYDTVFDTALGMLVSTIEGMMPLPPEVT
ncbi:MAG: flagellar biosynthetic protein FliR [Defluviitaleaceae bacterium]|nr:flagellar biosynthetic protein FliR [Defluviitaleaceae bacterium]